MKKIETKIGDVIVEAAKLELMFGYSHVITALYKEVESGEQKIIFFPINHRDDLETIINSDDILKDAFDAIKEDILDRIE